MEWSDRYSYGTPYRNLRADAVAQYCCCGASSRDALGARELDSTRQATMDGRGRNDRVLSALLHSVRSEALNSDRSKHKQTARRVPLDKPEGVKGGVVVSGG